MTIHEQPGEARGRFIRLLMAGIWLFYLSYAVEAGWQRHDLIGWIGIAATVLFAIGYLTVFVTMPAGGSFGRAQPPPYWMALLFGEFVLAIVMCACVGQPGTVSAVYLAVSGVVFLPSRPSLIIAVLLGVIAYGAGFVVPGWSEDRSLLFGIGVATLATWGIRTAIGRNLEVVAVREENARLAVAEERNRFARDLHDILGHSLTVITVKAQLANRLVDLDPAKARAELADLERLSRDALADVRQAISGFREITLPGELVRARASLNSANIVAVLPNSTDAVPTESRELFAWAVREGVTNVLRHSGAKNCTVSLEPNAVEIRDDGRGACTGEPGSGLVGLNERAQALGGRVVTESLDPGFRLRVELPA